MGPQPSRRVQQATGCGEQRAIVPRHANAAASNVRRCAMGDGVRNSNGHPVLPALGREAARCASSQVKILTVFFPKKRGCWHHAAIGAGIGRGYAKLWRTAGQEAKATGDPEPGHRRPCAWGFSLLPWDTRRAERTFWAQHQAEKVPTSSPGLQSLHVPANVFCSPGPDSPIPRTTRSFDASSHRSSA